MRLGLPEEGAAAKPGVKSERESFTPRGVDCISGPVGSAISPNQGLGKQSYAGELQGARLRGKSFWASHPGPKAEGRKPPVAKH